MEVGIDRILEQINGLRGRSSRLLPYDQGRSQIVSTLHWRRERRVRRRQKSCSFSRRTPGTRFVSSASIHGNVGQAHNGLIGSLADSTVVGGKQTGNPGSPSRLPICDAQNIFFKLARVPEMEDNLSIGRSLLFGASAGSNDHGRELFCRIRRTGRDE